MVVVMMVDRNRNDSGGKDGVVVMAWNQDTSRTQAWTQVWFTTCQSVL